MIFCWQDLSDFECQAFWLVLQITLKRQKISILLKILKFILHAKTRPSVIQMSLTYFHNHLQRFSDWLFAYQNTTKMSSLEWINLPFFQVYLTKRLFGMSCFVKLAACAIRDNNGLLTSIVALKLIYTLFDLIFQLIHHLLNRELPAQSLINKLKTAINVVELLQPAHH